MPFNLLTALRELRDRGYTRSSDPIVRSAMHDTMYLNIHSDDFPTRLGGFRSPTVRKRQQQRGHYFGELLAKGIFRDVAYAYNAGDIHRSAAVREVIRQVFDADYDGGHDVRFCDNCSNCYDRDNGYSDVCSNCYVDDDEDESDDGADPRYNIGEYHSSKRYLTHLPSEYDLQQPPLNLGLELEIEVNDNDSDRESAAECIRNALNTRVFGYCCTEYDGSLKNGFEVVTGWTGLDVHERALSVFKNRFRGTFSHDTATCGLHVHIDRADASTLHLHRILTFIHAPENEALIRAVARRYNEGYCKVVDKSGNKKRLASTIKNYKSEHTSLKKGHLFNIERNSLSGAGRYEAVNIENTRTLEFRLFRGTLVFETMMACLEFTRATWLFCRDNSDTRLTKEEFLRFIQQKEQYRETRYLRSILKARLDSKVHSSGQEFILTLDQRFTKDKQKRKERVCA